MQPKPGPDPPRQALAGANIVGRGLRAFPRRRAGPCHTATRLPSLRGGITVEHQPRAALVTGASSGIGAAFARVLAERGWNLAISARRSDRLVDLRKEITARHGVRVTAVENDLDTTAGAQRLFDEVRALEPSVSMLINNAGFGTYGLVTEQDLPMIHSMIQVNVTSLTTLTRLYAAQMRGQGGGYLLNVASFAALQPIPRYAVYSGAKAYVVAFSQALRHELRGTGVRVSVLAPGFTATEFHDVARHRKTKLMQRTTLDARCVAKAGLAGLLKGRPLIVPGWWYRTAAVANRVMPRSVASALAAWTVRSTQDP
jgi:short-subunit dehydrogenase